MNHKSFKIKIIVYMWLVACIAIVVEMVILGITNKAQVHRTSNIMLNQIDNILTSNEQQELQIIEELKSEYIDRAHTVAYIINNNVEDVPDVDNMRDIAMMMSIDEICLFDENGVIYGGTNPEYNGLSFDSGEQIGFFKPMLSNRDFTMCQDVMPNTAVEKSMIYAITWDETKSYMVQVGIEPVRLIDAIENNNIYKVIKNMPVYEGMNIYVADVNSGEILGTTDDTVFGKSIYDGFAGIDKDDDLLNVTDRSAHINGYRNYCSYKQHGDLLIAVVHSTRANVNNFLVSIIIEMVCLLVAGSIIAYTLFKLANANKKINDQMTVLTSISDIYYSMHLIDMADYSIEKFEGNKLMDQVVREGNNASDMLETIVMTTIVDDYKEAALSFVDLNTLNERLKNKRFISMDAKDKNVGWLRITFIKVEANADNNLEKVIIATQIIEEDKRIEEELSFKANRDELTGLYNRRAYEDDILRYPDVPPEEEFTYVAIDINGLKYVNDNYGHAAGDELIKVAAECIRRTFGNYGRVYRTGGDEFVAMVFADEKYLNDMIKDIEDMTIGWKGNLVSTLSISIGCATKREFPNDTVMNMSKIADKRMYKAKSEYYSKSGVDRRGQQAAHIALCKLYVKILKINLTDDSFSIVNMDASEQVSGKGYSESISKWLYDFGTSGRVHEDDLDEYLKKTDINYLRNYFKQNKTSISILYRRKYEDSYKQTVMEMIPTDEYDDNNQSLFLYVKSIDR